MQNTARSYNSIEQADSCGHCERGIPWYHGALHKPVQEQQKSGSPHVCILQNPHARTSSGCECTLSRDQLCIHRVRCLIYRVFGYSVGLGSMLVLQSCRLQLTGLCEGRPSVPRASKDIRAAAISSSAAVRHLLGPLGCSCAFRVTVELLGS